MGEEEGRKDFFVQAREEPAWREVRRQLAAFGVYAVGHAVAYAKAGGWTAEQVLDRVADLRACTRGGERCWDAGALVMALKHGQPGSLPTKPPRPEYVAAVNALHAAGERRQRETEQKSAAVRRAATERRERLYGATLNRMSAADRAELVARHLPSIDPTRVYRVVLLELLEKEAQACAEDAETRGQGDAANA